MSRDNPYNWQSRTPEKYLTRPVRDKLRDQLLEGLRLVLVGGHGMGKTVLLTDLSRSFDEANVKAVFIAEKAQDYTVKGCTQQLAEALGIEKPQTSVTGLFQAWFENDLRNVVLLERSTQRGSTL